MITEPPVIYEKLAEKHGLTVEQVREAVVFFWRTGVKRALEAIETDEIYIARLGSFKLKTWKLKYVLPQSIAIANKPDTHERNVEYFTFLSNKIQKIQEAIKEKQERYNEFLRQHPEHIQKPPSDMGGVTE